MTGRHSDGGVLVGNENFSLGDTVFVKPDDAEAVDAPLSNWVAKVLEVRAASEAHVFLRIFWMYRPEDIPGGRRPYHGRNEVIASNTMQVIDALTVNGKASVRYWTEDDNNEVLDGDQLFWRQTFNCPSGTGSGELSVSISSRYQLTKLTKSYRSSDSTASTKRLSTPILFSSIATLAACGSTANVLNTKLSDRLMRRISFRSLSSFQPLRRAPRRLKLKRTATLHPSTSQKLGRSLTR